MRILICAVILAAGCAPQPVSQLRPGAFMRWTAATDRIELIPSDSADLASVEGANVRPGESYVAPRATGTPFPPLPAPRSVRGATFRVVFMIDERGRIESLTMPALEDREYSLAFLRAMQKVPFKPATKLDGTPIRAPASVQFTL
jgi:hypothetical protein